MHYVIALAVAAFVLAVQYFLSEWLIRVGYFYAEVYYFGLWLLLVFLACLMLMPLVKMIRQDFSKARKVDRNMLRIREGNHEDNSLKICALLVLGGSFWINIKLGRFQEEYEYSTFGIKTKAVIAEKYELQNKGRSYIFVLQTLEGAASRELKMSMSKGEYARKQVGDTLLIMYSPRYRGMKKVL